MKTKILLGSDLDAFETLWRQVVGERLAPPVREFKFHEQRKWRFDYAWSGKKVAVEIDGGTWVSGRHVHGQGFEREKLNAAVVLGWRVLRFTSGMIE